MSSLTCKVLYQSPSKASLPVSYIKGVIPLPQNKVASAYWQLHFHFSHPSNCFKMNLLICCSYRKKVKSLSCVQLFVTPQTITYQAPLTMGFPRQEYWSGLPFLSPGDLPDPGIELRSPALQADALTSEPPENKFIHNRREIKDRHFNHF